MKKVLGISAFYHDSAAAIIVDGNIAAAVQEERFTRKKHTPEFPTNAIKYCLEETGLSIDELDAIVFYDKPLLKFERLLETYYAFAPKGLSQFILAIPIWIKEKLFLEKQLLDGLKEIGNFDKKKVKFLFPEHHLSHAASSFFPSPFREAAILTIDGVGEWSTATIGIGKENKITFLKEMRFPNSIGLLYSAFTYYLGFKVNSGEYKLMGLAPYGDPISEQTNQFISSIKEKMIDIKEDGSIWMNQDYFDYAAGLKMINEEKWSKLFGFPAIKDGEDIEQHHCNLALAIQNVTEEVVVKMALYTKKITGAENLCMAGGVALNCVANGKLLKENIFKSIYIQPAAGDAGGALGAALIGYYMYYDQPRTIKESSDSLSGSYLGPAFSDKEAEIVFKRHKAKYDRHENFDDVCKFVAEQLSNGKVVGWFQGRMEFGPRALGNRSILGDARNAEMQKKLNLKIKYREGFRPFAPSVLFESVTDYFDFHIASPYMLFVGDVKKDRRNKLPENYYSLDLWEKLYYKRSDIQSVTHLDFSARLQTVHKDTNPKYWQLIETFKNITGYGIIINTSFNVRGEPIVCTPEDAYKCFMSTEMDILVINNFILDKRNQPNWEDREKWQTKFDLD